MTTTREVLKKSALTNAINASNEATSQALEAADNTNAAIQEALKNSDINPDYISYDIGVEPDFTGAPSGTIGAYFKDEGVFQKLKWDGATTSEIGEALIGYTALSVTDFAALRLRKGFQGQRILAFGKDNILDGGGGEFIWDERSYATINDAGYSPATGITMIVDPILEDRSAGDILKFEGGAEFTFTQSAQKADTQITGDLAGASVSNNERSWLKDNDFDVLKSLLTPSGRWKKLRWPNPISVLDIKELLGLSIYSENQHVRVLYFKTPGDRLGGDYFYDKNKSKDDHDGIDVIDPTHSSTPDLSYASWRIPENSGSGCWIRLEDTALEIGKYVEKNYSAQTREIIAHGGWVEVTPTNTLAGIQAAIGHADSIEFDVQITADDIPVVIHNATIDATSDGTGRVDSYTYNELLAFDFNNGMAKFAGTKIPKLEEALEVSRGIFDNIYMDVKPDYPDAKMGLIQTIVEDLDLLDHARMMSSEETKIDNFISAGGRLVGRWGVTEAKVDHVSQYPNSVIGIQYGTIDYNIVDYARKRGVSVIVYTINDPSDAQALQENGVTRILTERLRYE